MRLWVKGKPDGMTIREYVIRLTIASVRPQRFKYKQVVHSIEFHAEGVDN